MCRRGSRPCRLAGAMLYAYSFAWVRDNVLPIWAFGKITLSDVIGLPVLLIYALLAALALVFFRFLEARRLVSQVKRVAQQRSCRVASPLSAGAGAKAPAQ